MSNPLVRLFTCASVISLAGLTAATTSIVACSSSSEATPTGDDDDTTDDDDDDTTTKKDGGSSSGSTKTTGDAGGEDECNPIGTWTIPKPTFLITSAGAVCDNFVKGAEKGAQASEVTITKDEKGYKAVSGGATLILAAADEGCEIGGGIPPVGFQGVDGDGNAIQAKLTPTQFYIFDGDKITSKVNYKVESDPPGAKGSPCDVSQISNGTRKQ